MQLLGACIMWRNDQYKLLTQLTSSVDNVMHYCNFNKCEVCSKQLMFGSISTALFTPADRSETSIYVPVQQDRLSKQLNDLSEKIADLTIKQTQYNLICQVCYKHETVASAPPQPTIF